MPGYRVGPLSFISSTHGYGLIEFDTTELSPVQQLVVTENGGAMWQVATPTPLPAWASTLEFIDVDDGYAWGSQGLDVTHDGGQRWSLSLSLDSGSEAVSPIGTSIWAISSSNVLQSSTDGGITWLKTVQPPIPEPSLLTRVSVDVAYVLGCGQNAPSGSKPGDLARTEDGGRTWERLSLPQGCTGVADWSDLVALSESDLWLVQFGQPATDMSAKWVYRSHDGGAHWALMASANDGSPNQGTGTISPVGEFGPLSVLASEPDRAWLAEDRGGLLATTDGGLHWHVAYNDPNCDALGPPYVSFLDADHGWAAAGDGLWRTTDGNTWTEIASPPEPTTGCRANQLRLSLDKTLRGLASQAGAFFRLANISGTACSIFGYPGFQALGMSGSVETIGVSYGASYQINDPGPHNVPLSPGQSAYFGVGWGDYDAVRDTTHGCINTTRVVSDPPNTNSALSTSATLTSICPEGGGSPKVTLTAVAPKGAFDIASP